MLKETVFEDAVNLLLKGNADPRLVIQLFGDRIYTVHDDPNHPILLFDGIRNLLEQLKSIDNIGKYFYYFYYLIHIWVY